ncbi:hypothetical protein AAC387_Pa07g0478 [Persea americana]
MITPRPMPNPMHEPEESAASSDGAGAPAASVAGPSVALLGCCLSGVGAEDLGAAAGADGFAGVVPLAAGAVAFDV